MNLRLRPFLQFLVPLLIVALGFGLQKRLAALREAPLATPPVKIRPLVGTVSAQASDIQLVVHAQGVVRPRTATALVSEVEGRVLEIGAAFREGSFFEQGELLLRLDDTDLRSALEETKSRVAASELMLAQEEADADVALRDWRSLHASDPPPPLVARIPQLNRARADLAAAKAASARSERDLKRALIHAPYPGRVQERMVEFGTFVTRGQKLAQIYAVDFAEVRLPIPDRDLAALDIPLNGEEIAAWPTLRLEAEFGGATHSWEGRIVRTTGVIDPMSRMLVLVAEVEDPYGLLREGDRPPLVSGLFVDAWIEGRRVHSAFSLPREALRPDNRVFVLGPEDRLQIRDVDVVRLEREHVIVRSGIGSNDRVIYTPLETPIEGMLLGESPPSKDQGIEDMDSIPMGGTHE